MIRKATSIFRKTIIVVLTLGAVVTGLATCLSMAGIKTHRFALWVDITAADTVISFRTGPRHQVKFKESVGTGLVACLGKVGITIESFALEVRLTDVGTVMSLRTGPRSRVRFKKSKTLSRPVSLGIGRGDSTVIYRVMVRSPFLLAVSGLLAAYPAIAFIRGPVRRWRRPRRSICLKCGYNLTGNVSGTCPECGKRVPDEPWVRLQHTATLSRIPDLRDRGIAVSRFALVHALLGVLITPALVVALYVNVGDTNTCMGFALPALITGLVLTVVDSVGYGVGLSCSSHRLKLRKRRLRILSAVFPLGAFLLAPLEVARTVVLNEHPIMVPTFAMLVSAILGVAAGRFCRQPIRRLSCLECGYDLSGNLSGTCPECGRKVEKP